MTDVTSVVSTAHISSALDDEIEVRRRASDGLARLREERSASAEKSGGLDVPVARGMTLTDADLNVLAKGLVPFVTKAQREHGTEALGPRSARIEHERELWITAVGDLAQRFEADMRALKSAVPEDIARCVNASMVAFAREYQDEIEQRQAAVRLDNAKLKEENAALKERVAALEATALLAGDVWRSDRIYKPRQVCTHDGLLWEATEPNSNARPGKSNAWRMMHKSLVRR